MGLGYLEERAVADEAEEEVLNETLVSLKQLQPAGNGKDVDENTGLQGLANQIGRALHNGLASDFSRKAIR